MGPHEDTTPGERHVRATAETGVAGPLPCPECAFPRLTLLRDGDVVSVFKCPKCGHLAAPVKEG